jgi:hypothetical protein
MNELKTWLGDAKFLELLNLFAGSYIMIPPTKKLLFDMYDYMSALAIIRIKKARKAKDLRGWSEQESVLGKIAKRTKRTYRCVRFRGIATLRKIERAKDWAKKMKIWDEKHLGKLGGTA